MSKRNVESKPINDDADYERRVPRHRQRDWDDESNNELSLANFTSEEELARLFSLPPEQERLKSDDSDAIYRALIAEYRLNNALERYDTTGKSVELYSRSSKEVELYTSSEIDKIESPAVYGDEPFGPEPLAPVGQPARSTGANAQRRANKGRVQRQKASSSIEGAAETVDVNDSQLTTYSDEREFGPYESPAAYDDEAFGPAMEDGSTVRVAKDAKKDRKKGQSKSATPDGENSMKPDDAYDVIYTKKKSPVLGPQDSLKPKDAYDVTYTDEYAGPAEHPTREFMKSDAYRGARDIYDTTDKELAVKVGRRLKLGMFTTKKTREASSLEAEAARVEYERMSETFDAIQIEKWKAANPAISEEEISHKIAKYHEAKLRLQGLRSQAEVTASHGKFGKLSEWNNKATEWYAGLSRKQKVGIALAAVAVGAGGGLLVAAAGTVLGTAAGVVGGGMMAAAKVQKTTMQGRAGLYRNTTTVEKVDYKNSDGTYKTAEDLRKESAVTLQESLDKRAEKADKVNKKTKWMTIASVALLGAGVASHIEVVHNVYKAAEEHIGGWFDSLQHPTGTPHHVETGITPSQGGGSGHNPIDKLGSGDVYKPPQVSVPIAPSHDVFVPKDLGGATEFKAAGLDHFNQWVSGHTVQPGESVWKLSQDYLQANGVQNPSVFQIDAVKDSVLAEFSAKGLVDSNGWLTAGELLNIK